MNQVEMRKGVLGSWIDGRWGAGTSTFTARNPADGTAIGELPTANRVDVDSAVAAASAGFHAHRWESSATRAGWCRSAAGAIRSQVEYLAGLLSTEHGKPVSEARLEVLFAAQGFEVAADSVLARTGIVPNATDPYKRVVVRREGVGVWAVITPWNFPVNIPVEYLAPALATGNAVVWKPAPTTAAVASALRGVLLEADFPQELLQLVITDDVAVAGYLTTHPGIVGVGFTGGSGTGSKIAQAAWDKKLLLELGGNTPVVVLGDADLEIAAKAIGNAAYWNAGQVCSAAGRILVARDCIEELAQRLVAEATALVVGDPLDETTTLGAVHLAASLDRYDDLVNEAQAVGAKLMTGGARTGPGVGTFYEPTVLTDVPPAARLFTDETFGPIASLTGFDTEEELLELANSGRSGLVGALFTRSLSKAFTVGERLECGVVTVNETSNYWEHGLPFGGAGGRESGRGRIGGAWVLDEFTQVRTLALDIRE